MAKSLGPKFNLRTFLFEIFIASIEKFDNKFVNSVDQFNQNWLFNM
jgi:hypothetical protein